MSRWNLAWLLGLSSVAALGISLTYSAPLIDSNIQKKHENLKLVVDVLEEVQQKYVRELDPEKMRDLVENMVNSGLEKLDPHSGFINADEYKQFENNSKGKFGGIGIRIGLESGLILVESPMVGTPAYDAGIMAGDIIVKIDGKSTETMALKRVVEHIQGEPGTKLTLTVLHEGTKKPVDIEITRAEIKVDTVLGNKREANNLKEWDFWIDPDSKIAYVRITNFTQTTTAELTKIVDALQKTGMKGLVVDLRNNPGGLLSSAVEVSSLFLPEGEQVVTTKGRGGVVEKTYNAHHDEYQRGTWNLLSHGDPHQSLFRQRQRNCRRRPTRSLPCRRRWRAQLWQRQCAERHPHGRRHERFEANHRELLATQWPQHPSLSRCQGKG